MISQMFSFVQQLNKVVKEYGSTICKSEKAIVEVRSIDD